MATCIWMHGRNRRIGQVNYMELQVEILSLSADLVEAPDYIMVLPLGYISSEKRRLCC